jgi:two-component system, OmpR family, sensor kinase
MKTLVEDLLLLARLDETRPVQRTPIDLAVVAADACSDATAVAPGRRVVLDAPEPVVVAGDGDHLRQAVANLVGNALRHTPPGTPIDVSARRADDLAVVVVRDHGPGLAADTIEHVFDRFWQADHARTGVGAGLGLSIVAAIIDEHGGTVSAANAEAGGAEFTIRLPLDGAGAQQSSGD